MATLLIAPTGDWRKKNLSFCWFGEFWGAQKNLAKRINYAIIMHVSSTRFSVARVGLVKTVQTRTGQLMVVRNFCTYMKVSTTLPKFIRH